MAYFQVNFAMNYIATIKTLRAEEFDPGSSPCYSPDKTLLYVHVEAEDEHKAYELAQEFLKKNKRRGS